MHFNQKPNIDAIHWETPKKGMFGKSQWSLLSLTNEFDLMLDPCANNGNASCCDTWYTPEMNGLVQDWKDNAFLNPPYKDIDAWLKKTINECENNKITVVGLLPSYTGANWFHQYVLPFAAIRLIEGRVQYWRDGESCKETPNFYSLLAIWRLR